MDERICKRASTVFIFPTAEQFHESAMPQEFSLPMPIMKYIWSNPSSAEMYQKLIKCCKFFFIKNHILILKNLQCRSDSGWKYCDADKCQSLCPRMFHIIKHKRINLDKQSNKICVTKRLHVSFDKNMVSNVIPKICRYDIEKLELNHQHLFYDDLKFLATGVKECLLVCNIVKYKNAEEVELENVIKLFSGAEKIEIAFANNICKSYEDLVVACNTVKEVELCCIPDSFDTQEFYRHLKKSKNRCLIYISSPFDESRHLKEVTKEILKTKSFEFVPPVIQYHGQNGNKLRKIQQSAAAKYR